jgi:hypothetical protein
MSSQVSLPQATTTRTVSRSLLRKVAAKNANPIDGERLEDIFPDAAAKLTSAASLVDQPSTPPPLWLGQPVTAVRAAVDASPAASEHVPPATPPGAVAWSGDDEAVLQSLMARRKAAGYKRPAGTIGEQAIRAGTIKPNADTIVAVIVSLVTERETLARGELVSLMALATFPHPKARPYEPGWCQGYIAGALRNGFLALASGSPSVPSHAA